MDKSNSSWILSIVAVVAITAMVVMTMNVGGPRQSLAYDLQASAGNLGGQAFTTNGTAPPPNRTVTCDDTDGGENLFTAGVTTRYENGLVKASAADSCANPTQLQEWFCNSMNEVSTRGLTNCACSSGACVPDPNLYKPGDKLTVGGYVLEFVRFEVYEQQAVFRLQRDNGAWIEISSESNGRVSNIVLGGRAYEVSIYSSTTSTFVSVEGSLRLLEPVDTTPPVISNLGPRGQLSAGTRQATLIATTNEKAVCRYTTRQNIRYDLMEGLFTNRISNNHEAVITVADGRSYSYYVKCRDTKNNANQYDAYIGFSVAYAPSTGNPPGGVEPIEAFY